MNNEVLLAGAVSLVFLILAALLVGGIAILIAWLALAVCAMCGEAIRITNQIRK